MARAAALGLLFCPDESGLEIDAEAEVWFFSLRLAVMLASAPETMMAEPVISVWTLFSTTWTRTPPARLTGGLLPSLPGRSLLTASLGDSLATVFFEPEAALVEKRPE